MFRIKCNSLSLLHRDELHFPERIDSLHFDSPHDSRSLHSRFSRWIAVPKTLQQVRKWSEMKLSVINRQRHCSSRYHLMHVINRQRHCSSRYRLMHVNMTVKNQFTSVFQKLQSGHRFFHQRKECHHFRALCGKRSTGTRGGGGECSNTFQRAESQTIFLRGFIHSQEKTGNIA